VGCLQPAVVASVTFGTPPVSETGGGTPEEFASRVREEIADHKHVAAKIGVVPQ